MKLYDENNEPIAGTILNNVSVTLSVRESYTYVKYSGANVSHVIAYTEDEAASGPYDPDPDDDQAEESIVYFAHEANRTLSFDPDPQDVQHDSGSQEYRVEFAVPSVAKSPEIWDGDVKVYEGSTLKKTIPLKVTVRKGGPGHG